MPKSPCRKHNYYPDVRVPQRWQEPALALTFSPTLVSGAAAGVIPPGPSSLAAPPEMPTMGPVQQQGRPGRREEGAAVDPARSRQCLGLGGGDKEGRDCNETQSQGERQGKEAASRKPKEWGKMKPLWHTRTPV